MANTSSAKKAIRVAARRKTINNRKKVSYKSARKSAVKAKASKESVEMLSKAYQAIDKAAKTNVIHKKTAARYKSRLAKKLSK